MGLPRNDDAPMDDPGCSLFDPCVDGPNLAPRVRGADPVMEALSDRFAVIALILVSMGLGFYVGCVSGPYVLQDLDVDVYYLHAAQRVYAWRELCALGFGCLAAVLLALVNRRRHAGSRPTRLSVWARWCRRVVVGLGALYALLLWGWTFGVRGSSELSLCGHHLHLICLAIESYRERLGCLPPAFIPDENGNPKHSWRVLILPFVGDEKLKRLYDSYDFSEPWDGPHNRKLANQMPSVYGCPGDPGRRKSMTSYVVVVGERTAFPGARSIKLEEIRDDKSITLLFIETTNSGINWMEPRDFVMEQANLMPSRSHERSVAPLGGAHMGCADGGVRFLRFSDYPDNTNQTLRALATIDGAGGGRSVGW